MQRTPRLSVLALMPAAAFLVLPAQQTPQRPASLFPPRFAFVAPYIPPVSGAPFSANYAIEEQRPLATGGTETLHSITRVARDSNGRIRQELHDYLPPSVATEPRLMCVVLFDRVARLSHILDPVLRTDDRQWFNASNFVRFGPDSPAGENLGSKTIDGLAVNGVRRTRSLPSHIGDSGPPAQVVDEIWYSSDLQLVVFEQRKESSGGAVTVSLAHLDRREPSASLFKVSRDFHVPHPPAEPGGHAGSISSTPPPWLDPSVQGNISGAW